MKTRHFFAPQKEAHPTAISLGISEFTFALFLTLTELLFAQALPPYHVDVVDHFGGEIQCLSLRDSNGFVKQGEYFKVLDMTSPALTVVGSCPLTTDFVADEIYSYQNFCCFRSQQSRMLVIIDVTDPRHPRESGKLTFGSKKVEEFAFYEHYVYAAQREEGVRIIDIADPANPTLVGTFSTNAVGIAVQGNRAYVVEAGSTPIDWEYSNFLVIYDLGDPLNPVERGRTKVFRAREVIVSGEYAYTAGNFIGTYAGLRCIRVSDPTHPTVVDSALVDANMGCPKIENNLLYISKRPSAPDWKSSILIFDIANPPGKLVKKGEWVSSAYIYHYAVQNPFLYAFIGTFEPLRKVNIANPQNPVEAQRYDFPTSPADLFVYGNHLFIADKNRLFRYEITNPEEPVYAGYIQWSELDRVCVRNNVLYALAEREGYLRLWDISDFANHHSLAQINPPAGDTFQELGIRGNFVYLATQLGSFQIWDVSTPTNPIKKGELSWPDVKIMDLFVPESGDLIYIAYANPSGQSGYQVKIINAANAQAPQLVKTLETTGLPFALAGEGYFLYVASSLLQEGRWILSAYNVTDPVNPALADTLQGSGQTYELEVKEGVIIGTFPGGTVRYFVYDQHSNQLILGPAAHSGDDNRLATTTDPQGNLVSYVMQGYVFKIEGEKYASGQKGIKIIKARKRGANEVVLTMAINPSEAASQGCTTLPKTGSHLYTKNSSVTLRANPIDGWNFVQWTGDVSGTSPEVNVVMDRDKIATANFVKPILWLHANSPDSSIFYPYQVKVEKDTVLVQEIILEVNDVDDWQLTEIRFKAEGTGDEPVDIYRAFLVGPGYSQWKQYSQDDGLLRFTISKTIPKGQSVRFRLYYDYSHNLLEPVDTLKTYRVKINTTMVEAKPVHYENYQKLPSEWMFSNPIEVANVINKTRRIGYVKIKDATAQATDGDQIEVGPGEYDEHSIKIGKKGVSLYSYKGLEFTIIKPTTPDSSILCVEESGVSIRGFNISCGNGKEGIDSHDNRYLKIENCRFEIDDYCETGIYAVRTKNLEINDCTIQANNNALSGIWIGNCCNVTIQKVNVSFVKTIKDIDPVFNAIDGFECDSVRISHVLIKRCRNGIKFQKSSNVEIVSSFIRENLDDGISITDCKSIRIIGNKAESGGLLNNYKNGISLSNSDNCWIERNDIHFNQWGGIFLYGGRGTFIRDNGIIGNPLHGTQGISISGGKGYISNNNSVCGNQVSRSLSGIFIKESRGDRIFCNDLFQNTFGVSLSGSNNIDILFNNIKENRHGISSENSTYTLRGNVVDDNGDETPGTNYSAHTGVHLFQSLAQIIGNSIHNDHTDGIIFEQGSSGTVTDNMIYANQGAGLKNLDPSVSVTATGNWWGDASGPAGIGPGKGDEVEGTVDFSNWLTEPLGVRVYVESDTVYSRPGAWDSVYVSFRNWRKTSDVLNVTITDPLGWVASSKQFQVTVVDSLPNAQAVIFAVPANAVAGAADQVTVAAASQSDASLQHEASFMIRSYAAVLTRIMITPDSVWMGQGHRRQFTAVGLDQHGQPIAFTPVWSATGGIIDSTGMYTAGMEMGTYEVRVRDQASGLQASAKVEIVSAVPVLTRIEAKPDSLVLFPQGQATLSAQGYDQFYSLMTFTPVWHPQAGSIDAGGLYTAPADTGQYRIVLQDSSGTLADTAKVRVVPHGVTLISPADGDQQVAPAARFCWLPYPNAAYFVLEVARDAGFTQLAVRDSVYWRSEYRVELLAEWTQYYWRVWAVTYEDSAIVSETRSFRTYKTGVEDRQTVPERFALYQNYPNPFNSVTTIAYDVPGRSRVIIAVYDIRGRFVETLVNGKQDAGRYLVRWNARRMAGGVYFVRMTTGESGKEFVQVKKMVLLK